LYYYQSAPPAPISASHLEVPLGNELGTILSSLYLELLRSEFSELGAGGADW